MGLTNFISQQTVVTAAWLNGVDQAVNGVNVVSGFGADPTGVNDNTGALFTANAAATAGNFALAFPPGFYLSSTSAAFTCSIYALSRNANNTVIACSNPNVATAFLQGSNVVAQDLTFFHGTNPSTPALPTAGTGAHGLVVQAGSAQAKINRCQAHYNDRGIAILSGNNVLWVTDCTAANNAGSGFLIQDPNNFFIRGNIASTNVIHGFESAIALVIGSGMIMSDNLAYNNYSNGFSYIGLSGTAMNDLLITNNLATYNRGNGFYFDTHGINFELSNNYSELCGYETNNSIYSQTSCGYSYTANNASISMNGCQGFYCTGDGVFNGGTDITIAGGKYNYNGQGSSGGYGIADAGNDLGFTNVTGATISGNVTGVQNTTAGYGSFYNCNGLNQASFLSPPSMPASTTGQLNPFNIPVAVTFYGGTLTGVQIKVAGTTSSSMAATSGTFILAPGQTIIPTYSSTAPSWIWIPI